MADVTQVLLLVIHAYMRYSVYHVLLTIYREDTQLQKLQRRAL